MTTNLDNTPLTELLALAKQGLRRKTYQKAYTEKYYKENTEQYLISMRKSRYQRKGYNTDEQGYPIDENGNRIQLKRGRPRKDACVCQNV